jgi:hypothetical protein
MRGPRVSVRVGLEGLSADRRRVRPRPAGGPAGVRSAAGAGIHAGHEGRVRTRRKHQRGPGGPRRRSLAARLRDLTLAIYGRAVAHAETCGIIIADTKFEFGLPRPSAHGAKADLILIDEVLTPDSSRFWPRASYEPGRGQPSYDKQFVRDHLERIGWNKQPPVPALPPDVVAKTREKYLDAYRLLTGHDLPDAPGLQA